MCMHELVYEECQISSFQSPNKLLIILLNVTNYNNL